jgi:hypothetical protein
LTLELITKARTVKHGQCVGGGVLVRGRVNEGWNMVDGRQIPVWNRTKEPLAIALSGVERGKGERCGVI